MSRKLSGNKFGESIGINAHQAVPRAPRLEPGSYRGKTGSLRQCPKEILSPAGPGFGNSRAESQPPGQNRELTDLAR